ncbi:MAG: hypothetical protein M3396_02605 [Actinomycetota bacterium]|nr:hypothetical protein [Actinomycetota bacterium]MDQ3575153.1 hypothetical protein [Actinomycetota bacterium]
MDDREVVQAFVARGATRGFGVTLHIDRDALLLDGWWQAAFRVAPLVFIVRVDQPPSAAAPLEHLAAELTAQGLTSMADDLGPLIPLIGALTYAELSLGGGVGWSLWAVDRSSGEAALRGRVGAESFLDDAVDAEVDRPEPLLDVGAELEGTRRMLGLDPTVVLAVGLHGSALGRLQAGMPDCRFESVPVDMAIDACAVMSPALVLVDATGEAGRAFVYQLRSEPRGRSLPVVALSQDQLPLGAEVALDPDHDPLTWVEPIRRLLP